MTSKSKKNIIDKTSKRDKDMQATVLREKSNRRVITEEEFIDGLEDISDEIKEISSDLKDQTAKMKRVKTTEDLMKLLSNNEK